MKNTVVSLSVRLLASFTQPSHFSVGLPSLFPLFSVFHLAILVNSLNSEFLLFLSKKKDQLILQTRLPVCQWQLPAQGIPLYQVGCLGRGLQSSSETVAHPHRSKHTCAQICKIPWKYEYWHNFILITYWILLRLTSFERFMSLRTLMTMVDSVSLGLARLAAPSVRRTDRMLRRPKS